MFCGFATGLCVTIFVGYMLAFLVGCESSRIFMFVLELVRVQCYSRIDFYNIRLNDFD
jgi:hypothetical protein